MQITLYLDVIFLVNFLMDCLVLSITNLITKQHAKWWRILLGAMVGAMLLLFFVTGPYLYRFGTATVIYIGISYVAVLIAFGRKNVLSKWLLSTTIMISMGIVMNYIKHLVCASILTLEVWIMLVIFAMVVVLCFFSWLNKTSIMNRSTYLVQIKHAEHVVVTSLFMDTGNLLFDPLFQKPVIVLSENIARECFTEIENRIISNYFEQGMFNHTYLLSTEIQKKDCFHEICYESIGNQNGRLPCFLADEITIFDCKKTVCRQPIAIGPDSLFCSKHYQGLLQPGCIS